MRTIADVVEGVLVAHAVRDARVCVALSGGMDSAVLLALLHELGPRHRLELTAIHVNHALSPNADRWESFCRSLCMKLGLALSVAKVAIPRDSGMGLEAAAREARYAVFSGQPAEYIALAHHLDDQVETVLIQLLRGAGAGGLSAMPVLRDHASAFRNATGPGPALLRPLLDVPRSAISAFARDRNLQWVEDESNADVARDRNFLRRNVLPIIATRFPAYRRTLARAANNLKDAVYLADALAQIDAHAAGTANGLKIAVLRALPQPRAVNLLRHLFVRHRLDAPRRRTLQEALRQCLHARDDSQVRVDFGDYSLRCYRRSVFLVRNAELPANWHTPWQGEERLLLPNDLGNLRFVACVGAGLSRHMLTLAPVSVRARSGGERISLGTNRPHRALRDVFQQAGIAPWRRRRIPLVFCGSALVCVPGIAVAAEFQARADESAISLEWEEG